MLTPQQIQTIRSAAQPYSSKAAASSVEMTPEQAKASFGGQEAVPSVPSPAPSASKAPGIVNEIGNEQLQGGQKIVQSVQEGASQIEKGINAQKPEDLLNIPAGIAKGTAGAVAGAGQVMFSSVTPVFKRVLDAFSNQVMSNPNFASQHPVLSKILDAYDGTEKSLSDISQKYPQEAGLISDVLNASMTMAGAKGLDTQLSGMNITKPSFPDTVNVGGKKMTLDEIHSQEGAKFIDSLPKDQQVVASSFDDLHSAKIQLDNAIAKNAPQEDIVALQKVYNDRLSVSRPMAATEIPGAMAKDVKNMFPEKAAPVEVPKPGISPEQAKLNETRLQAVANDWEKPTKENFAAYNDARAVLAKDPTVTKFIAQQGANPFTHIEDGKYFTEDLAQTFRDTPGKLSEDMLRPSLETADYSVPRTPVKELVSPTVANVKGEYGVTAGDAQLIEGKVRSELAALEEKYPDGMSLTNMHDEKITYAKNGGYSPIKSNADNNTAIANRAISRILGDMVESKAPENLPIHDFNASLQQYYRAADYLDALNQKKAPPTILQSVARGTSKFGGALIARHLIPGGGDLVSSFAGYQLGKAAEMMVENMTNPMRDVFLKNLEITNPEAFKAVKAYLGEQATKQATILKLPPGAPQGTEMNPTPLPAPKPKESTVKLVPAKPGLPAPNPKTGKMQRTYLSQ